MTSYIDRVTERVDTVAKKRLERDTRPFRILPMGIMTLLSSVIVLVGAFTGGLAWLHTQLPFSVLLMVAGGILWLACCPQFLLLSRCRTLLRALKDLEKRVEESKHAA